MRSGYFITFEGGEGVGKSTLLRHLETALQAYSIPLLTTREPGGTPFGEAIRQLFLARQSEDPLSDLLLILAARRRHLQEKILPALEAGTWVLCDRYWDSTLVYQGILQGQNEQWITCWHQYSGISKAPDLTFIVQEDPAIALQRRQHLPETCNRWDQRPLAFHQQVAQAFQDVAQNHPQRCILLPSGQSLEALTAQIIHILKDRNLLLSQS